MRALFALAVLAVAAHSTSQTIENRVDSLEALHGSPLCGNGVVNPGAGEECDDGNVIDGDGCSMACQVETAPAGAACGDGAVEGTEECDDGNTLDGDGCSATCTVESPPAESSTGLLSDGTWTPIPGSEMRSLYDPALDDQWDLDGAPRSFEFIQDGWSGAACVGDELLLMGGGHGDGAHNGVFAVNVHSGAWRRVTMPSPIWRPADCPDVDPESGDPVCSSVPNDPEGTCVMQQCNPQQDGAPAARHTYGLLASDGAKLYATGGSIWRSGNSGEQPQSWELDLATGAWSPLPDFQLGRVGGGTVHVDGRLYVGVPQRAGSVFDLSTRAWSSGATQEAIRVGTGLVWVPSAGRIFALGDGTAWSLPPSAWPNGTPEVYEPQGLVLQRYPGLTYYEPEDLILLWKGGPTIETLDPHTGEWGSVTPAGEPGPLEKNGTFGRFNYCDGRLVLVNGVDRPMYFVDVPLPEEPEPEPEPPPVEPPPSGVSAAPYYAHPPGDLIVERDCGPLSEWEVYDIRTDEELANAERATGDRVVVRLHWREQPYAGLRMKGKRCVKVLGVPGPNGEKPWLAAANATKQFRGEVRPGGLIVDGLDIRPGDIFTRAEQPVAEGIGVPNDQTFLIIRNTSVSKVGHHSFTASHAHHLYVEIGNSHFSMAGSHLAYINHVAMAWIYDSTFASPGWGHALRCVALRCVIERTKVSNVQLDGTWVYQAENPQVRNPGRPYIGMHPLEVYTCGENELRDVEVTTWVDSEFNIPVGANLRAREGFNTCDVGEPRDGEWTPLVWGTDAFVDPARWEMTTDLVTTVENVSVECVGPQADRCFEWTVGSSYPWADDYQKAALQDFLKAEKFSTWEALVERVETDTSLPWWWGWLLEQVVPSHRASFLKGTVTNKVPLPVPVPGWRQRARIVFDRPTSVRPDDPNVTYCLGVPPVDGACVEQADGRSFDRAIVVN